LSKDSHRGLVQLPLQELDLSGLVWWGLVEMIGLIKNIVEWMPLTVLLFIIGFKEGGPPIEADY
jgi:hypothetical protein